MSGLLGHRGLLMQAAGGGGGGDPYWSNVSSLLHFDGADGSTTFTDQTGKTWTAHGNAQIDTAQSKFGGASGLFDGSGDYATTPNSADFDLGSGDFTIEAWVRRNGTGVIVGKWRGGTANACSFLMDVNGSGKLGASIATSTIPPASYTSATTVPSAAWAHVAVVRSGTALLLFIDGVKDANTYTLSGSINYYTPEPLSIGAVEIGSGVPKAYFNGHIDELRVTKGVARYTSAFTPPTAPFPNS